MAQFYASLGPKKAQGTRMAVIDMSAAFEKAMQTRAPMAVINRGATSYEAGHRTASTYLSRHGLGN